MFSVMNSKYWGWGSKEDSWKRQIVLFLKIPLRDDIKFANNEKGTGFFFPFFQKIFNHQVYYFV